MYAGPTSAPFECARLAAILGWQAWEIAADLRVKYGLPPYTPDPPFHQILFKRVRKDERDRQKSIEGMKELLEAQRKAKVQQEEGTP